jgi:hypothetical protein
MSGFRSMYRINGQADLYPFVLSPRVIDKLGYIGTFVPAT